MNLKEDKKTQKEKKSNFPKFHCCKIYFTSKREIMIHYSMALYNRELLMTYGNKANCEDCNNRKGRQPALLSVADKLKHFGAFHESVVQFLSSAEVSKIENWDKEWELAQSERNREDNKYLPTTLEVEVPRSNPLESRFKTELDKENYWKEPEKERLISKEDSIVLESFYFEKKMGKKNIVETENDPFSSQVA